MFVDMLDRRIEVRQYVPVSEPCCSPLTAGSLSEAEAVELASILKAIADPLRLRLLSMIANEPSGEVCACDLPELFDRSQPTMSHHLSLLVKAGLLDREQRGKWAWFRVVPDQLDMVATVLRPDAKLSTANGT